ncbi:MAG: S8 family peptidase [Bacteroidia bacterium]|nr:S8 family peptidase [Bacteroidia bacterium]
MKNLSLGIILFFSFLASQAQQVSFNKPVESSSIIIQFDTEEGLEKLRSLKYGWISGFEVVYQPYHIYKANIQGDINKHLTQILSLPFVAGAQPNRPLERRALTPDDSLYENQWNMKRILMDSVWGITSGGPTTLGDTVVIAIIDAGFDTTHPDFGNNLWINKDEKPGSLVDNDSNGYAGDYLGWNTYADKGTIIDSIEFATHGMSVTGVIGAVGNNEIGIAGISWKNKFLAIIGGGDEANAIKSYGYVLTQKKRYLETNGQHGAYIVSVNSSWGKSGMFALDAPIWCALYDSMGKYGILNATSVSNSKTNLDNAGDLPTLCPSDYTITVTNTNSLEDLHGGFGKLNVDLGAPGSSILTTGSYIEQKYKYSTGTSLAAPHVAAVIGILYSAACDSFIEYAHQYPDSAALWVKYFIMNSVDTFAQLSGNTVSGGRLNAYKALLLLNDWCDGTLNHVNDSVDSIPLLQFSIFPNPGQNSFVIKGEIDRIGTIQVVDFAGKTVIIQKLNSNSQSNELTIQTNFVQGIYIVRILDKNNKIILKQLWSKM